MLPLSAAAFARTLSLSARVSGGMTEKRKSGRKGRGKEERKEGSSPEGGEEEGGECKRVA